MQKITTHLWFDDQAAEAADFYVSLFPDSGIESTTHYADPAPPELRGKVMTVTFRLAGQQFLALNGGPSFRFTEAISLVVSCETQEEVDRLWTRLTADGGEPSRCGWLKDRFGLSWQIVPTALMDLMSDPDPGRSQRAMTALLRMDKIDIAALHDAANG